MIVNLLVTGNLFFLCERFVACVIIFPVLHVHECLIRFCSGSVTYSLIMLVFVHLIMIDELVIRSENFLLLLKQF